MRIVSWNVNGIRAVARKGFFEWLEQTRPDVLCVQETKADPAALGDDILVPLGYHSYWAVADKKGYSGVATFCREEPRAHRIGLGIPPFDSEGRVVVTDLGAFELYNVYFPNRGRGPERVAYKIEFYEAFLNQVHERMAAGKPVIFCGDVNTAHQEIDLARPKENSKVSGFLPGGARLPGSLAGSGLGRHVPAFLSRCTRCVYILGPAIQRTGSQCRLADRLLLFEAGAHVGRPGGWHHARYHGLRSLPHLARDRRVGPAGLSRSGGSGKL